MSFYQRFVNYNFEVPLNYDEILEDLKNHTPYSIPFLKKVSSKEASDYHKIIKYPMDLSTMTKYIDFYDDKSFIKDLELIWNNCFTYNKEGLLVDYAIEMRRYSKILLNNREDKIINGVVEIPDLKKPIEDQKCINEIYWTERDNKIEGFTDKTSVVRLMLSKAIASALKKYGIEKVEKTALLILVDVCFLKIQEFVKKLK